MAFMSIRGIPININEIVKGNIDSCFSGGICAVCMQCGLFVREPDCVFEALIPC